MAWCPSRGEEGPRAGEGLLTDDRDRGRQRKRPLAHEPDGRSNEVLQNLAFSSGKALALVRLRRVTFLSSLSEMILTINLTLT